MNWQIYLMAAAAVWLAASAPAAVVIGKFLAVHEPAQDERADARGR